MELRKALKIILSTYGLEMLNEERLVNMVSDYGGFENPAHRRILTSFIDEHCGITIQKADGKEIAEQQTELLKIQNRLEHIYGYKQELIGSLLNSIAWAIGWKCGLPTPTETTPSSVTQTPQPSQQPQRPQKKKNWWEQPANRRQTGQQNTTTPQPYPNQQPPSQQGGGTKPNRQGTQNTNYKKIGLIITFIAWIIYFSFIHRACKSQKKTTYYKFPIKTVVDTASRSADGVTKGTVDSAAAEVERYILGSVNPDETIKEALNAIEESKKAVGEEETTVQVENAKPAAEKSERDMTFEELQQKRIDSSMKANRRTNTTKPYLDGYKKGFNQGQEDAIEESGYYGYRDWRNGSSYSGNNKQTFILGFNHGYADAYREWAPTNKSTTTYSYDDDEEDEEEEEEDEYEDEDYEDEDEEEDY